MQRFRRYGPETSEPIRSQLEWKSRSNMMVCKSTMKGPKMKLLCEYEENPASSSKDKGQKPLGQSDCSSKWKSRSNELLCKSVLKLTKMKVQCEYEVNPSSGSAKNGQKHFGRSNQI